MDPLYVGLWAAHCLTRQQHTHLMSIQEDAYAAIGALWEDEHKRPRSWGRFQDFKALIDHAQTHHQKLMTSMEHFPQKLQLLQADALNLRTRSPFLTVAGSIPPPSGTVGIVGTRGISTDEADQLTRWLTPLVRQTRGVISGGAYGVDAVAHNVALEQNVPTWVVFASGLAHISPRGNRAIFEKCLTQGGGWISEKAPWYKPFASDFLERNEVIASLSSAVLVARAPVRSGALSTARFAQGQGKPILAFPGNPDDPNAEGCHHLLQRGALWATPSLSFAHVLQTDDQMTLVLPLDGAEERTRVQRPVWDKDEERHLRQFLQWQKAGEEGWMGDDASAHQEILLDLELGGWITHGIDGIPTWTDRGKIAQSWILSETESTKT